MNNTRRKRINELKTQIDFVNSTLKEVSKKLSSILSEEQDAFDNMPEGLQSSYRGMCSEDAIDSMEEASEKLDEVILCKIKIAKGVIKNESKNSYGLNIYLYLFERWV